MRFLKHSILLSSLLLCACHDDQNSNTALVEKSAARTVRPIISVVSVNDTIHPNLAWDLSKELTLAIRHRLADHNSLYLLSDDQVRAPKEGQDPFGSETAWLKTRYSQNEFVTFFELIDHRETPIESREESPAELTLSMRVRVFDLRQETPKIVLEEVVAQSHHIPAQFTKNNPNQVKWGDETFEISPLGIAHEKLCQEVASRVEDYILLSCKR